MSSRAPLALSRMNYKQEALGLLDGVVARPVGKAIRW